MSRLFINVAVAMMCNAFTTGMTGFVQFPSLDLANEFHSYVYSFIMEHFPEECVCFFKDSKYESGLIDRLMENVGRAKLVTLVSPIDDAQGQDILFTEEPFKPFPCSYVVHLPYVGSNMPWMLLRGKYFTVDLPMNESRYLILAEESHLEPEIQRVLMTMFNYGFLNVDFLNFVGSRAYLYTLFPFGRDFCSCPENAPVIEIVSIWNGRELRKFLPAYPSKLPTKFKGCLWNISCAYYNPYIISENGGEFLGPLEGYDAGPLSLMVESLNLTPRWNINVKELWQKKVNDTYVGSVPDLVFGRGAQMSCGGLSSAWTYYNVDITMFYSWTIFRWFVAAPDKLPKWKMLVFALDKSIWPYVLASMLFVPSVYWMLSILCQRPKPFSQITVTFIALSFGNVAGPPPAFWVLRMVFMAWLIYIIHIDQLYLASLTGLITSAGYEPMIKTSDQLIESQLPTAGFIYTRMHLTLSHKEDVQTLLKNFFLTEKRMNYTLLELTQFKNFTVAENEVYVKHILGELSNVSIYPTDVTNIEFTINSIMWRHNYLFDRVNRQLNRMFDTGFPVYFLKKFFNANKFWSKPMDRTTKALKSGDLAGPFLLLTFGLLLSCLIFIVEIILFKTLKTSYGSMSSEVCTRGPGGTMYCFFKKVALAWLLSGVVESTNPLYDCVIHIIRERFPEDCICFFVDGSNHSSMFGKLIHEIGELSPVYVVSPEPNEVAASLTRTRPVKPFPCYFIIDLPYVGSTMIRSFLSGSYQSGDYNLTESRYLVVAEEHHTYQQAVDVLRVMFMYGFIDVDIVNPNEHQIDIFTYFPYGREFELCPETSQPILEKTAIWLNSSLVEKTPLFPRKFPTDAFAGCSWNISCGFFTPYVIVDTGGRFSGPLPGYDASPLSLLVERLNLTPEWTIDITDFWFKDHNNGSFSGAIPDLMLGRGPQMCCGGLYQTTWALGNLDPTHFHTWATIAWFVAAPNKIPKWIMIFMAMSKGMWAAVIGASIIVPTIYWVFCVLTKTKSSFGESLLMLTALGFSNSSGTAPSNPIIRIIFTCWLFFALHIDQFYLASLTGLITSAEYEPTIKTPEELIASKLPTAAYHYTVITLMSSPSPTVKELMKNYKEMARVLDYHLNQMSMYKNFSIADNTVFVKYTVSQMPNVSIYPTQVTYQERAMSALMWRHNFLFDRINWLLLRMFDAGFPVFFLKITVPNRYWTNPKDSSARPFNLRDLGGPFHILIAGLWLSFVAFISELLYFKCSRRLGQPKRSIHDEDFHHSQGTKSQRGVEGLQVREELATATRRRSLHASKNEGQHGGNN